MIERKFVKEILTRVKEKSPPTLTLERFLEVGGYPKAYDYLKNPKRFKSYIKDSLVRNVIGKDILLNNNIKKLELFK